MLKDLLEKFDKEFDEQFVDESGVNDRSPDDIKSLAHSHIEAAYRVGMNIWLSVQDLYQEGFKAGQQSNLERLIEKCGDKFGSLNYLSNGKWEASGWDAGEPTEASTPTEAVENLIKALNK